jgi:hypothetical protein
MKKQQQLGLVVEGRVSESVVLRLPSVLEQIGPIMSPVSGMAKRISHSLHAGYVADRYDDLQVARTVLLCIPDGAVDRTVKQIYDSDLVLEGMAFVLCETWLTSDVLNLLTQRGASVATLVEAATASRNWFVLEGQSLAVRRMSRIIEQKGDARAFELQPGGKPLYFAAELLAAALPLPFLLAAEDALRASGLSGRYLYVLLKEIGEKILRGVLKGARFTWGGPLNQCSAEMTQQYLKALREAKPDLAEILDRQLPWAEEQMRKRERVVGTMKKMEERG